MDSHRFLDDQFDARELTGVCMAYFEMEEHNITLIC